MTENGISLYDSIMRPAPLAHQDVVEWLLALRGRPYVPASDYDVTAVIRARAGGQPYYFAGVNVENTDTALSVHGEGAALSAMLAALGKGAVVEEAWVMAAPRTLRPGSTEDRALSGGTCCGRCRQHLWEFAAGPDMKVHAVALNGTVRTHRIADLLPGGFSFASYNDDAQRQRLLAASSVPSGDPAVRGRLLRAVAPADSRDMFVWLRELQPVDYASGTAQGIVIVLDSGAAVAGTRMEDAAFTGLTAAQAATANAVTAFGSFRIARVFGLTHGGAIPAEAIVPLPLSALQVLREFGASRMPLTLFTPGGQAWHTNITAAADVAPTYAKPWRMLWDGQLGS